MDLFGVWPADSSLASDDQRRYARAWRLAIRNAVAKAAETVKHMRWLKVAETRGNIHDGKIDYWQVTVDIGFTLE